MVSRRIFMKNGGLTLVSLGFAPSFLARTVEAARQPHKILITIFQRGAVDGLNMVVPFAEDAYYRARPSIAIPRPGRDADGALDLDGFFGLHPRMASLAPWFTRGQLAIVHATESRTIAPGRTSMRRTTWRAARLGGRARVTGGSTASYRRGGTTRQRPSALSR